MSVGSSFKIKWRARSAVAFLACLGGGSPAWSGPPMDPAAFGFSARTEFDGQTGRRSLTFTDRETRSSVLATYSPLGDLEAIEYRTPAGSVTQRREFHSLRLLEETFVPERSRRTVQNVPGNPGIQEIELVRWKATGEILVHARWWVRASEALAVCAPPAPPANAATLLADLSWLNLRAGTASGDRVELGNNLVAQGCQGYPGGTDGLAREVTDGLRTGLACLSRLGGARRQDAGAMLAFLQSGYGRPAQIFCGATGATVAPGHTIGPGANAQAWDCTDTHFPAMQVNTTIMAGEDAAGRKNTMLHEMLHWLGYRHYETIDVTYLASTCCMTPDSASSFERGNRDDACSLMRDNPAWTSTDYLVRFTRIMARDGRSNVAARTAFYSLTQAPFLPPPDQASRDGSGAFLAAIELGEMSDTVSPPADWRENGSPFLSLILGRAAMSNLATAGMDAARTDFNRRIRDHYYPTTDTALNAKRELGNWVGQALGDMAKGEFSGVQTRESYITQALDATCSALSENEKRQMSVAIGTGALTALEHIPPLSHDFGMRFSRGCEPQ